MAETREALILAGIGEFSEHGLDVPSLDQICARAGFTRGAFYVHFKDREDFIVAVMDRWVGAFLDAIIGKGSEESGLAPMVRRYVAALRTLTYGAPALGPGMKPNPEGMPVQIHRLLEAGERSPRIRERLASLLAEAVERVTEAVEGEQAADTMRRDVDAEQIGTLLVAVSLGAVTAVEAGLPFDPEEAGEAVVRLLRAL